jgi:uncharacterized protein with beta-barrel porin domain
LRRRVLLSGTMLVAAFAGYGRRAYGACLPSGGSTYQCSGTEVTTQVISANNAAVSTLPGFSVNSAASNAITINGDGAQSYTDINASSLTTSDVSGTALYIRSGGDYAGTPGSVTINTNGALTGGSRGIYARNFGSGATTVTANGDVTGTSFAGINANNSAAGTDLTVTTGAGTTVSSGVFGIFVTNQGTGALTITANGDVTGTAGNGINATNSAAGTDLTVTTAAGTSVSGYSYGIYAANNGTGALTITANGNVTSTGTSGRGIYARNSATGTALTVTTGAGTTVSSGQDGIIANNYGTGAMTITANGNVTGASGNGIYARNNVNGTTLTVTTGAGTTVSGAIGIEAKNFGSGALTITANGNVTGTTGNGIYARNSGTDLSVTTAAGTTISGGAFGIEARNSGTGALTITANGNVTGTGGPAIYALNYGTALTVTTAAGTTVSGTSPGILARNNGTGALTIIANGDVTSTGGRGILARNDSGTTLSVTTAAGTTVSGASYGIFAYNAGTGATTITANGNVTGTTFSGIYARNTGTGTTLSVTTAVSTTVSGTNGIYAYNAGTGALTITANGNVTGTTGNGIYARNNGANLSVTTAAGTTVSGNNGIFARHFGTGAVTVTTNGDVTGTSNAGIDARSSNSGTGLSVTTAAGTTVSGGTYGIFARNGGTGALTVIANGNVTGTTGFGIVAQNFNGTSTNLTVTTGAGTTVSGGDSGIYARNLGTGALAITLAATGTVSGGSGFGIQALGGPATVTVAGTVNGGAGGAIRFDQAGAFANRLELVTGAVINGNVLGGTGTDTLALTGTGSGSFNVGLIGPSQQYRSFEAFQKGDTGTWTLTGTNTLALPWTVAQGTLLVNANMTNAPFTVIGGVLSGIGTVGNTLVSGGTFAPGSGTPGSSMTVNGTLGFNAVATFAVNVNPTTSSFANVSGAATLGGATVNAIFAPGSYIAKQYTILTAGSISGAFGTLTNTNLPANFADTLSYDATHAYLNLSLAFIAPPSSGLSGNQSNVGNALINYFNANGGIPLVFGGLAANGLSQASGQPGASTAQSGITGVGQFANAVFDSAFDDNGQGGAAGFAEDNSYAPKRKVSREAKDAYAAVTPRDRRAPSFEARWNVWASVYGGNSRVNGDSSAGTNTTTSRIFGTVAGASYRFTPDTLAGFALGGAGSSFDVANGFGGGKADVFNIAAYAKHNFGSAYVAGLLGYSWQDTTTDRTVTISGTDRLHASFKAQALTARLEGGWRYATPMVGVTPYGALQSTTFYLPAYGETATSGSNTFALSYASKTVTATRSELGAKFDKAMLVRDGVFTLKAKTAWAHDWNTDRAATATFQALPGATFTTNGAQPSANAALVSLGGVMDWHNGWSIAGSFDGEFSRTTASYAGKGTVRYAW